MRDDLLDAYAAIDWAITHVHYLDQGIDRWHKLPAYGVVEEDHPEMGKKLLKLQINRPVPRTWNAAAGAIINSTRTSLDLLAASLARRNGKSPNADRHFPIFPSHQEFIDPMEEAERKKWLSEGERGIIEGLKPYEGGNDILVTLHRLDVTRKHDRLVNARLIPTRASVSHDAYVQGFEFPAMWPGFDDGAVIAWTRAGATNTQFQMTIDITINEAGAAQDRPLLGALRHFARAAHDIVELFE